MILDLLDVEGLEEGRLQPAIDRVDLVELVRATVRESQVMAQQKRINLSLSADERVWAQADPVLTRRVVDNLVSNALTHGPQGSRVDVTVNYREEGAEIVINDEGPGVPEQLREKVFDKYAQVEKRDVGVSTNRGLGLTFCRLAVEAQGGTVWIEEAPGGGASFRTLLPAADTEASTVDLDTVAERSS